MKFPSLRPLLQCEDGTSVTEFGLIAIPLFMMTMGTLDVGHTYYVKAVLTGELNKLARSSSLEGATTTSQQIVVDERLRNAVKLIAPNATVDMRY
jgi:Flp pilus assembly protein TadG